MPPRYFPGDFCCNGADCESLRFSKTSRLIRYIADCRSYTFFGMAQAADEMLEHRADPAEKKSQRNTERHFRFPAYAFAKNDWNFAYAQRATCAHHGLEHNFETAGLRR